jgi:hypothetical protein
MSAKQILLDWLAKNELKKVFQGLLFLAEKYKDEQLRSNTAFQSGRLKSLENQWLTGTISQEENHLQAAKVREAIVNLINGLPDDWILDGEGVLLLILLHPQRGIGKNTSPTLVRQLPY